MTYTKEQISAAVNAAADEVTRLLQIKISLSLRLHDAEMEIERLKALLAKQDKAESV